MKYLKHPFLFLWAFLTGGTAIALQDYDGEIRYSVMHPTPFGEQIAYAMWFHIGLVICNPDGTTRGPAIYVKRWTKL